MIPEVSCVIIHGYKKQQKIYTKQLFEALKISFENVTGKKFEEEMKSNNDKGDDTTNDSDN